MDGSIDTLAALLATAGGEVARGVRRFDIPLLAVGLLLHLVADVVRNAGWYGVLRAAGPEQRPLRMRDVQAATFAGGGVNTLVPARAGDLVKLAVLRRRAPEARMPTLMATLLPETLFECVAGALLLAWALSQGYLPVTYFADALVGASDHPVTAALSAVALAVAAVVAVTLMRRWARRLSRDLGAGVAILRTPGAFVTRVATWQLAGRVVRLAAISCCLTACRLPGGLVAATAAMAIDGGTRLRFAPATAGLRLGLLGYALPAATGTAVSVGALVAYMTVMKVTRTACFLGIAAVVLVATFGARSPRHALAALRRLREAAPVEAAAVEAPVVSP
jgi:lysylphosphatidylglycerol synthase-like protein